MQANSRTPASRATTIGWRVTPPVLQNSSSDRSNYSSLLDPSPVPAKKRIRARMVDDHSAGSDTPMESLKTRGQQFVRLLVLEREIQAESQQRLRVWDEEYDIERFLVLCDDWAQSEIAPGTTLLIIGAYINVFDITISENSDWVIDSSKGMIVVNPDYMLSCTNIASSFECTRKALLQIKIIAGGGNAIPLVHGNMLHLLFQSALVANNYSTVWLNSELKSIIAQSTEELYQIDCTEKQTLADLQKFIPNLQKFQRDNILALTSNINDQSLQNKIYRLLDIEERIWSTKYGIKGNIDSTVQLFSPGKNYGQTSLAPLELKTGKPNMALPHRTQAILYGFLLSDKYDMPIPTTQLTYLSNNTYHYISAPDVEKRAIIMGRNALSDALLSDSLPRMLKNKNTCGRCFVSEDCFMLHKAIDDGNTVTAGVELMFNEKTDHLSELDNIFLKKWMSIILVEEQKISKVAGKDTRTVPAEKRELEGTCLNELHICNVLKDSFANGKKQFSYTLSKSNFYPFHDNQFSELDAIIVRRPFSNNPAGIGWITQISATSVTISIDKQLDGSSTQIKPLLKLNGLVKHDFIEPHFDKEAGLYIIDQHAFSGGLGLVRNNVMTLFRTNPPDNVARLRELVIEGKAPVCKVAHEVIRSCESTINLNTSQQKFIDTLKKSPDYVLLLGMPGTGKTTTIAVAVKILISMGYSILLTSYTHSAVDNVLLKLIDMDVDFLRIGAYSSVLFILKDRFIRLSRTKWCTIVRKLHHMRT